MEQLRQRLLEIYHLNSILAILGWDRDVFMPCEGAQARAAKIAYLSGLLHQKIISLDSDGLLSKLKERLGQPKVYPAKKLPTEDMAIVRETWRSFKREKKLTEDFVKELAETTSQAQMVWAESRKKADFKTFLPWLEKILHLKKKEAGMLGYDKSPYDLLLDYYEPGMTAEKTEKILNDLKISLSDLLKKIKRSKVKIPALKTKNIFSTEKQIDFNKKVAKKIGFNFDCGRMDQSVHPFCVGFHPNDVRITTRYDERDPLYSFGSTIHEAGHALYEQGILPRYFGTPLGEGVSYGIHESQSRLWENMIGKSFAFWQHFYPILKKEFPTPFGEISLEKFYCSLNSVKPSLIRTDADEVTYNLHVILRFEIERDLMEGKIAAKDLPEIWNGKMKKYLGVKPPNDRMGILQDVHWAMGGIGYFPTYALGNLYAAQFYDKMKKDMPDIEKKISGGNFGEIKSWLGENIYSKGKLQSADELTRAITGEDLNPKHFFSYIENKYTEIYKL
ncbi:carboxypeptidase M32 [Candidatus Parcubacteria bacterium]|nr:MAG: carboxypeptidase M32 [Candidatus Parcubacteria bacterium]